ncbi:MAG: succinate--CoA ligase subunit alpha [Candidatus Hermodarchaeota archaeon]|nr:succinate--CoA ligase subunit alpha [Candidatus Hermodarchaeota archaeon]
MTILVDKTTQVLVQGITGREGQFHAQAMREYGTKIVAGTTPGKGGQEIEGMPVFDSVVEAKEQFPKINASIIFVPARFAADAATEAIDAGLQVVTVITEHIPVHDEMRFIELARRQGSYIIGPNTPGIITPGECKLGIMPAHVFKQGRVGLISRSGTLTYEVAASLTNAGFGQSTAIGLGGDPIVGMSFVNALKLFEEDKGTDATVIIGEIGGSAEEEAAAYIKKHVTKSVIAYIAGRTAPKGKRMGHAGAIVSGKTGTADGKITALRKAGATVIERPIDVDEALQKIL